MTNQELAEKYGGKAVSSPTTSNALLAEQFGGKAVSKPTSNRYTTREEAEKLLEEGDKAKEFLGRSTLGQLFSKETGEELKKGAKDFFGNLLFKAPTKVIATARETKDILKEKKLGDILNPFVSPSELAQKKGDVKPSGKEYDVPFTDTKVKSYYSDFADITKEIEAETRGEAEVPEILGVKVPWQARLYAPLVEATFDLLQTSEYIKVGANTTAGAINLIKDKTARDAAIKNMNIKTQLIQPKRTPNQIQALADEGMLVTDKAGRQVIQPSSYDMEVASEVDKIISPKNNLAQNIEAVKKNIDKISNDVRSYLSTNKIVVDKNAIMKRIDDIEIKEWMKSDKTIENSYNLSKDWVKKQLVGLSDDIDGNDLWAFRKKLDDLFETQFGNNAWDMDKASTAREVYREARKILDEQIAIQLKDPKFVDQIRRLHLNYDASSNLSTWSSTVINKTKSQLWWKNHPNMQKALQIGSSALGYRGIAGGISSLFK